MEKVISTAVIKRLPRYYRYLGELRKKEVVRISSKELSERMNVTASQIRQDLNNFGGFGQQGYGYNIETLMHEIAGIIGLNGKKNVFAPFNFVVIYTLYKSTAKCTKTRRLNSNAASAPDLSNLYWSIALVTSWPVN